MTFLLCPQQFLFSFFVSLFFFRTDGGALPRDMSPDREREGALGTHSDIDQSSVGSAKGSNFVLWPTSGARKSKGVTTGQKVRQGPTAALASAMPWTSTSSPAPAPTSAPIPIPVGC